jgi:hypothetical protein
MKQLTHDLHEELAIRLLGWRWMAFTGIPVKGTASYPKKCRVRQLFSKEQLATLTDAEEATGDEPLSYAYCSSVGPAIVPRFAIFVENGLK